MKLILSFFWFLILPLSLAGQEIIDISGYVMDKSTKEPLVSAVIMYKSNTAEPVYTISAHDGSFKIRVEKEHISAKDSIVVSMLGYETKTVDVSGKKTIKIYISSKPIQIKEIIVSAPKVKLEGDTITYFIHSFKKDDNEKLEDVLKTMPGIEVGDNGIIKYNGKNINEFYIEGLDFLNGKYSIATKNFSAKDVKSVDIMENHQSIRALKGIRTGVETAMNIKLSESAKDKFIYKMDVSAGISDLSSVLWDGNIFLTKIGKKQQSISNLKSNNIGNQSLNEDELSEKELYRNLNLKEFIRIDHEKAPLEDKQVLFNRTVAFNLINSRQINNEWNLNTSLTYSFDNLNYENSSIVLYYLSNDTLLVDKKENAITKYHILNGSIKTKSNNDDFFLENNLVINSRWKTDKGIIEGTYPNYQYASLPLFIVSDKFSFIKNIGKATFSTVFDNSFSFYEHEISIENNYPTGIFQKNSIKDFNSKLQTSYGLRLTDKISFNITSNIYGGLLSLDNILYGINEDMPTEASGIIYDKNIFLSPAINAELRVESKRIKLNLSLPLKYTYLFNLKDGVINYKTTFFVEYKPVPKFSIMVFSKAGNSELEFDKLFSGYILNNSRNIYMGKDNIEQNTEYYINTSFNFKDPVNMYFINVSIAKSWNLMKYLPAMAFISDYIISSTEISEYKGGLLSASIDGSIGLYNINGKITANIMYNKGNYAIFQNKERMLYDYYNLSALIGFTGKFTRWLNITSDFKYIYNSLQNKSKRDQFILSTTFDLYFNKKMILNISGMFYFNQIEDFKYKKFIFLNTSFSYKINNKSKIFISANNILNYKYYSYSIYDGLSRAFYNYKIRPMNLLLGWTYDF